MSRGPSHKTFKFRGAKIRFSISYDNKILLIQKVSDSGHKNLIRISKNQARRLADWLEWWTK